MERRKFLLNSGALVTAVSLPEIAAANSYSNAYANSYEALLEAQRSGLSILQGLTTESTTQLTIDLPRKAKVAYLLKDKVVDRVIEPSTVSSFTYKDFDTRVDKIAFEGLELGHEYTLVVTETNKNMVLDERDLAPVDLSKANAKIALMSCMHNLVGEKDEMWSSAKAANLDYLFFIGDNVYGDLWKISGPDVLFYRYLSSRKTIPYYHWRKLKPVIAIWDDHDFGKNNSGGEYKYKEISLQFFQAFYAQEPIATVLQNRGIATAFTAFNQNFVFLDNRYFRGLESAEDGRSFLGREQIAHFDSVMKNATLPTWILQGAPLNGRIQKESSYDYNAPAEFDYFMSVLSKWKAPVIFGGGDLHYSELSELDNSFLGYKSYEVISSCMHSFTRSSFYDNPNKRLNGYLKKNFMMLQNLSAGDPLWQITCVAKGKKTPFSSVVEVG